MPANPATVAFYTLPGVTFGSANGVPTATFTLTDGALGDDDLDAANGRIVDAGAPVVLGAGGAAAIPTLSQWGVLLLSALLGLAALRRKILSIFGIYRLPVKR